MFEDFSIYDDCEPLGVELPKTSVSETVLKSIDLDKKSSTKEMSLLVRVYETRALQTLVIKKNISIGLYKS